VALSEVKANEDEWEDERSGGVRRILSRAVLVKISRLSGLGPLICGRRERLFHDAQRKIFEEEEEAERLRSTASILGWHGNHASRLVWAVRPWLGLGKADPRPQR